MRIQPITMNITNPFVISGYVSPHYFCDRVEETNLLTSTGTNDNY